MQPIMREILQQFDKKCIYCGVLTSNNPLSRKFQTLNKIVPKSDGGSNDIKNLVLSCPQCCQLRGNIPFEAYLDLIQDNHSVFRISDEDFTINDIVKEFKVSLQTASYINKLLIIKRKNRNAHGYLGSDDYKYQKFLRERCQRINRTS